MKVSWKRSRKSKSSTIIIGGFCHATNPIVHAAKSQIGKTLRYDSSYKKLKYPMGDLPIEIGVCTDVVIRALRSGVNFDLQWAVHEDMKKHFSQYPKIWGLKTTDQNIDHRRVPNLQKFFQRQGWAVPLVKGKQIFKAGDIVTCTVSGKLPHIMIVSDQNCANGIPLVIHNIGAGTTQENALLSYPIKGHFRIPIK